MTDDIKLSIAVIVGTLVLLGGIVGVVSLVDRSEPVNPSEVLGSQINTKGNRDAENVIVEFSDFQCPACAVAAPTVSKLVDDFPNDVYLEFRHFTLPQNTNSRNAAYAAEAASEQDKFWEVHNWLFQNQTVWQDESVSAEFFYEKFGEQFELNRDQFVTDYGASSVRQRVTDDTAAASGLRLGATPTFFVNGEKIEGAIPYETFVEKLGLTLPTPDEGVNEQNEVEVDLEPTIDSGNEANEDETPSQNPE